MYYVYILRSIRSGKLYTGFSKNLRNRLAKHKAKGVQTTKRFGKIELVFYEAYKCEGDVRRREKYLKTTKGKRALRLMLKDCLDPIV